MTKPKPATKKVKKGRKPKRLKKSTDKMLKLLFDAKDINPWQASLYAKCGYGYALKKYEEFSANLGLDEKLARISLQRSLGLNSVF